MKLLSPATKPKLKTALIYDRVNTQFGGAERLLAALIDQFQADLFSPIVDPDHTPWLKLKTKVISSWLNQLPFVKQHHQFYAPLMPLAVESFQLDEYDLIISLTSAESKAVLTKPNQLHLAYLLTPPRYLYQYDQTYLGQQPSLIDWLMKFASAPARAYLKWFDQTSSLRPDVIVPLSQVVRRRALQFYPVLNQTNQLTQPIYPFVTNLTPLLKTAKQKLPRFSKLLAKTQFNLSVARLVKYKRIDLAIKASLAAKQPLLIIGEGIEKPNLIKLAHLAGWDFSSKNRVGLTDLGSKKASLALDLQLTTWLTEGLKQKKLIFFIGAVNDEVLALAYQHANRVIAPGIEDFGLVPLEAAWFRTPSIINAESGVAEILTPTYAHQLNSTDSTRLAQLIQQPKPKQTAKLARLASQFSRRSYLQKIKKIVYDNWCHTLSYK